MSPGNAAARLLEEKPGERSDKSIDDAILRFLPPFLPNPATQAREAVERRRASRALTRILGDLYPSSPPRVPSTYGLTAVELRAEGNRLARSGWPVSEVRQVLVLPEPDGGER